MAFVKKGGGGGGGGGGSGRQAGAGGVPSETLTNLPPKTGPICGRKPEMQAVANVFNAAQRLGGSGSVEIVGREGVGATTVALELARRVGGNFPGGAWYVHLGMGSDVAWADLAAFRGQKRTSDLPALAAKERTRTTGKPRALIVLDGVTSGKQLAEALPPLNDVQADVFVVAERATGTFDAVVEVTPVPEHAARRIAHAVLHRRDKDEAQAPPVRSCDGLALTASLAARAAVAYEGKSGPISVDDTKAAVMRLVPLLAQNPTALELLMLCASAHPVRIPVDALFEGVRLLRTGRTDQASTDEVGAGILWLARLGIVMPDDDRRVSMHPLVQEVALGMAESDNDRRVAREAMARALDGEAQAALRGEGVDVRRAALHQLRFAAKANDSEMGERLETTLGKVEAALGV